MARSRRRRRGSRRDARKPAARASPLLSRHSPRARPEQPVKSVDLLAHEGKDVTRELKGFGARAVRLFAGNGHNDPD